MRALLLVVGWAMVFGAFANGALAVHASMIAVETGELGLSVEAFMSAHHGWLGWTRDAANVFLPARFVDWIFALPAMVLFPLRCLLAALLAVLCFKGAALRS